MKEELTKTTKLLLGMITVVVIIAIVILASIYYTFIPYIPPTELNLEALAILSGIFIPITFLIFVDITRDESWRNLEHYKFISIIILLSLFAALFSLFGAASIGIINTQTSIQNAISLLYISMSLCAIILIAILTIYVYIY